MASKKKSCWWSKALSLITVMPAALRLMNNIGTLAAIEFQQAKQNIIQIFIWLLLLGTLICSTWLVICAFIYVILLSLKFNAILSMGIIVILNFSMLCMTYIILRGKKNISYFPVSSQLVRNIVSKEHSDS